MIAAALDAVSLETVWRSLGGGPLCGNRGRAFWRNGDGLNVAIDEGRWFDHVTGAGGGTLALIETALECDRRAAMAWFSEHFGTSEQPERPRATAGKTDLGPIVAEYVYTDELNRPVLCVTRHTPKTFRQWRPNGAGGWIAGIGDARRPLYRLPEVIEAAIVFVVEGEKDVETLRSHGFVATCNPMGAGKWRNEYNAVFAGKTVIIIPDRDEPGKAHAWAVSAGVKRFAAEVVWLDLETAKDVAEWFEQGHSEVELMSILEAHWTTEGAAHG